MKEYQVNQYSEKERIRSREESIKYELLSSLEKETFSGPFTSPERIDNHITNSDNKRMHNEVKYAQMTSTSLKLINAVLHLKKSY